MRRRRLRIGKVLRDDYEDDCEDDCEDVCVRKFGRML